MTDRFRQRSDQSVPSRDEHEAFTRDWRDVRDGLRKFVNASSTEYDFGIKLRQHVESDNPRYKRRNVTTLDTYDIVRYLSSSISGASTYLDARLATPAGDEPEGPIGRQWLDAAKAAKAALEDWQGDSDLGFQRIKRRVIRMAVAARAGACRLDLVEGGAAGATIVPTMVDWRKLGWDLSYTHFNEWGCPWMFEEMRVPLEWVKAQKWRNVDQLRPDDGETAYTDEANPKLDRAAWEKHRNHVTLVVRWIKDAREPAAPPPEPVPLEPRRWYMACPVCGYSEHDLSLQDDYDGSALPNVAPCPQCGMTAEGYAVSTMERMEVAPQRGELPERKERHRKVIFAPLSPAAGLLEDKPWPKGLENFPYWMFVPDPFPLEPTGNSATFLNQDMQSLKNAAMRAAAEQMDRNHDLTVVLEAEYTDGQGEPYDWSGAGPSGYTAFTNNPDAVRGGIYHHQGSGLNAAFVPWVTVLDMNLTKFKGTGQLSMSPAQLKGTTATTAARVQETGDVPVDEVLRILREDLEQFLQRVLELMGGNYTVDQWVSVSGPSGDEAWRLFRPSTLPPLRLRVHAGPDLNIVDLEKVDKVKGMIGLPPAGMRFVGKLANLPSELVEQLIQETAAQMPPVGPVGMTLPGSGVDELASMPMV